MTAQVIVSNVAKHHAYETALALQERGWLKTFYTSFYTKQHPSLSQRIALGVLPGSLEKKLGNRSRAGLDETRVQSYLFPELLERLPPLRKAVGQYNLMNFKNAAFDWRVSMSDLECDIFHGFEGATLYSLQAAKKRGAATVLDEATFHVSESKRLFTEEYARLGWKPPQWVASDDASTRRKYEEFKAADYVFVASERIKRDFIGYEKRPPDSIFVVPYGCDTERFTPQAKLESPPDTVFRVLLVGILGIRKGVRHLLEAFKQLSLPNSELLLVGTVEDEFRPVLAQYEGIYRHIESVPNAELGRYHAMSSVYVLPSIVESFGIATAEAMASGLPVIVSENCGLQPRDGIDGFVVPAADVEVLKEKLLFFYRHEEARRQMGKVASVYIKNFTWDKYRAAIQSVYERLLAGQHSKTG